MIKIVKLKKHLKIYIIVEKEKKKNSKNIKILN